MTVSQIEPTVIQLCRRLLRPGLLALALVVLSIHSFAQVTTRFEITSIEFSGNASITPKELQAVMTTQETPGLFNKMLYGISDKLGKRNEYLNPVTLGTDLEQLRRLYYSRGFSEVRIDSSLTLDSGDSTVAILILIQEGYQSRIDTLTYRGLQRTAPAITEEIQANPAVKTGDPFNTRLLQTEVSRVLWILNTHGYPDPAYLRDSSYARRYTSTKNYSVSLAFDPRRIFRFGDIHIRQEIDTSRGMTYRSDITDDIILNQMDYRPGEIYNLEEKISSEQNLNRLGLFDLRKLDTPVPAEGDTSRTIPTYITIRPRDRHEVAPELIVSDENGAFNLGTGIGYSHRNFLGGARTFSTRLRFRTQAIDAFPDFFNRNNESVSNLDLTFEILQPYVFTNRVRGSWSFSFIVDKQKPYLQNIVKNDFSFTDRFAEFTTGVLGWSLESIDTRLNENYKVDSSDTETLRQLRSLQAPQFNSILSFTIQRDMSNDRFSPSEGFIHSATFAEAGLLPLALKPILPNLPFTQFYQVNLVGRWYFDLSGKRRTVYALKLHGGIEDKYGETRSDTTRLIPQTHRFYAGGSTSVRGWNSRELSATGNPQLGGNLLIEASNEIRWNMFQSLHDGLFDKIWLVSFVDVGNLWNDIKDFQPTHLAASAGFGLRYDTFFGPFRIDWGFRVYNPGEAPGQRWITERQLFGQTFKEGIFHFGIGNAF